MMNLDAATRSVLYQRLRRPPAPHSVPGSLPVLFFGDLFSAQIATIGINPSDREYLDRKGHELVAGSQRFETLTSLRASSRQSITDAQCQVAVSKMCDYFQSGNPIFYSWFRPLDHVTCAMHYTYALRQVAHLDLIQEATAPTWSTLARKDRQEASSLLATDLPFLRWQLATFPLRAVLCNGKTVLRHVCGMLDQPVDVDHLAYDTLERIRWYAISGRIDGRVIIVAGWNIPLARPTGLGSDGEQTLGHILAQAIARLEPA